MIEKRNRSGSCAAYWLVSQASYVLLGIALMNALSIQGAILQLFGLAIATPLLLWVTHAIEQRAHHTDLSRLGGLAAQLPDLFRFSIIGFYVRTGISPSAAQLQEFITELPPPQAG